MKQEEQQQTQEENQTPQTAAISFEDLCPDFDRKIKREGYESARTQKFVGLSGSKRALNDSKCCIVGEAFDTKG